MRVCHSKAGAVNGTTGYSEVQPLASVLGTVFSRLLCCVSAMSHMLTLQERVCAMLLRSSYSTACFNDTDMMFWPVYVIFLVWWCSKVVIVDAWEMWICVGVILFGLVVIKMVIVDARMRWSVILWVTTAVLFSCHGEMSPVFDAFLPSAPFSLLVCVCCEKLVNQHLLMVSEVPSRVYLVYAPWLPNRLSFFSAALLRRK